MLLNEMEIFYYVVKLQSFRKAAEKLGVSNSHVSKRISKLEQALKTRLLTRSTRKLSVTEAGKAFYQQCEKIVAEADKSYAILNELQGSPTGTLKVSVPPAFGLHVLPKMLADFLHQYPDIILDLHLDIYQADIIRDNYDLALRSISVLEDSSLIARQLCEIKSVLCASNEYIRKHGEPLTPLELEQHTFVLYSDRKHFDRITLTKNKTTETYVTASLLVNQIEMIKTMLLEDYCIVSLPLFMIKKEVNSGRVKVCLSDYQLPSAPLYAVYPERDYMPPKLDVFLSMLKNKLAEVI